jgi:hypothetical protein
LENSLFSQSERRLLAGLAVVALASWGRFFATASLKVDESYPGRVAGYALLATLVLGWALAVRGWRGILDAPPARPRHVAFAALLVVSPMLPLLSNDLFSVMAYGSGAAAGHDVYTTTDWLPTNAFYPFLGQHWNDTVCVYGPATLIAALPASLAHGNPWLGLLLLRVAWFVPLILVMEVTFRRLADRPAFHAMVWLNPLWLVEGPGQMHADLLGLVALTLGVALHLGEKVAASAVLYAAACWGKYSAVVAGTWFVDAGATTAQERLRRSVLNAGALAGVGVVLYAPFWHGTATITTPLDALAHMNPGGSITEVAGILVQVIFRGWITAPDLPVQTALAIDREAKHESWAAMAYLTRTAFVVIMAGLAMAARKGRDRERTALLTGAATIAFLTLLLPRFQCWYLLAALPFFGLSLTPAWKKWWVAIVAVSVPVDFACVLERTSPLYPVWGAVTTGAQVLLFVAWLKPRYFQLDSAGDDVAPRAAKAQAEPSLPPAGS